ncbi:MAG: LuxR C-terminal-related transcriptional regulator [Pseudonocardia sp.]
MSDPVAAGQAALAAGRWRDAADTFEAAVARKATAEALYGLGMALWWLGEQRRHVELCTAAYVAFRRARDDAGAVLAALGLCCTFKSNFGDDAVAGGWARRAERLVAEHGPLRGWVWQIRAYVAPEDPAAVDLARRAHEAGRRDGDVDLELCALATLGHALVVQGKVEEGLGLVDEAMAGTLARECEQLETTVVICCEMLDACDAAGDLRRAAQWCRVAEQFAARYGSPYLYVRCRVLYGAVLTRAGELDRAEMELRAALCAADGAGPAWRAQVLSRLATLRLCRGDIEEAESLVGRCAGQAVAVEPEAAVHMARGAPAVAVTLLERGLRSVRGRRTAALLGALVAAGLAAGDLNRASTCAAELADLADLHPDPDVVAGAALAAGRVALARGTAAEAVRHLERAVAVLTTGDAPLDAARARLELARALVPVQPESAVAEARAALGVFDAAGAFPDADGAAALLRSLGVAGRTGPRDVGVLSERERQVLHLITLGLSNPEIAERLRISRKTAAHHVSHVLTKLGLPNRAAAAAYATRLAADSG